MEILRVPGPLPPDTAACVGAFDGMHLGHRALLERGRALAAHVAIVTFEPRPAEVLAPDHAPPRLQSNGQRQRICAALGCDALAELPFDRGVAALAPQEFVDRVLIGKLAPKVIVVGEDFRFGRGRAAGVEELGTMLTRADVKLCVVAEQQIDGLEKIGSTQIRAHVRAGDMGRAAAMLGRWHALEGRVHRGAGRGRALGFPTANIDTKGGLLPPPGVYAVFFSVRDDPGATSTDPVDIWPGVANLGTNPTFSSPDIQGADPTNEPALEVHVLDRDLKTSLYDRTVEISMVARLRDERRFESIDALRLAISQDILTARRRLGPDARRAVTPSPLG